MITEATPLHGVVKLTPRRFADARGFFAETYSTRAFTAAGIAETFVQDNHSLSRAAGTIRGLHFQAPPHAQAKLVRCGQGAVFDVAVDLRRGSPHFGGWYGCELSAENGVQLYIPTGFAHGFMTLVPDSELIYKCSDHYAPETEGAVIWNDPDIAIDWPAIGTAPVLSDKDAAAPRLREIDSPFAWDGAP